MQLTLALLEHPVLLVILLMFFMGFVGLTYEFILRLFGRKGMREGGSSGTIRYPDDLEDDPPPPEPAKVPNPPTDPDDVLQAANEIEGAEEVEDEDGNVTVEYVYKTKPDNVNYENYFKNVPDEDLYDEAVKDKFASDIIKASKPTE